jgi:hypothetical protein
MLLHQRHERQHAASPALSARMITPTYLTVTTIARLQKMSESRPEHFGAFAGQIFRGRE